MISSLRILALVSAPLLLAVSACGSSSSGAAAPMAPATTASSSSASSAASASSSGPASASPASSPSTTPTPAPSSSASARRATPADVKAASAAALRLYRETPNDLNDPSKGTFWTSTPWAEAPVTPELLQRVSDLRGLGYFADAECGLDYLTGSQWGMAKAPAVRSAHAQPDGTVAVVVRRDPSSDHPDMTVMMRHVAGRWLAADLVIGTGPHASIFSSRPLC